nr:nucleotidyltransferase family protein [Salinibacter altiplanensis]
MRQTLRQHLPSLREEYGVESLTVFGSYVRGEQHPDSDIDLLVTFDDPPGLLAFIELERTLSDLLGQSVDLVTENALKSRIGDRVQEAAEPI